jgi:molybdopterin-synthase adenylyltransferase
MSISNSELERYQRQLLIEDWDQDKLRNATVVVVGLGGLGSISSTYLAAAGVGNIRICDSDIVELSNLNRQILFSTEDIGKAKAIQAAKRLSTLNPDIKIEPISDKLTVNNVGEIVSGCDLIIDGLDNHADRLTLNRTSYNLKIPFIYGAINEWQGQVGFFNPPDTPCLACIMPGEFKSLKPIPVFGALPGSIGIIQATLALEYLIRGESPLSGKLLIYHADRMTFDTVVLEKKIGCRVCGV